jgi:hypothetical protein
MALNENSFIVRGYCNFLEQKQLPDGGFVYKFSTTLSAGKDQHGNYKKEYFNVEVSKNCSQSNAGKLTEGDFVQIQGRIRNRQYEKNGQKMFWPYLEAFDLFVLIKGKPKGQAQAQNIIPPQQQGNPYQPPQHNNPNQYRAQPAYQQPAPPQGFKPPMPSQPPQQAPQAPQAPQGQPAPAAPPNVGQWDEGIPF